VSTNFRSDLKKSRGCDTKTIFEPTDFSMRRRFHERLWWNPLLSFPPKAGHDWSPIFPKRKFPRDSASVSISFHFGPASFGFRVPPSDRKGYFSPRNRSISGSVKQFITCCGLSHPLRAALTPARK
jgi:hypothetical protein